jgi:hypothetical protein
MLAASEVLRDPASAPPADDDAAAAMMQAKQPTWYTFLIPFLGFAGVMTGGTIRSRAASG